MIPTGHLEDDGTTLVLTRRFEAPIDDVWASITESERVARWYGSWTGDPADGFVMLTMNAEPGEIPPARFDIDVCEPPRLLAVSSTDDYGTWKLTCELSQSNGGTDLRFLQRELDPSLLGDVGAGWEWYLDRLAAAVVDDEPPSLADFEGPYMTELKPHYESLRTG